MKTILVFVPHMTNGGAERVLSELTIQWNQKGHQIILVETEPDMYESSYRLPEDVQVIRFENRHTGALKYVHTILSMIRIMRKYPKAPVVAFSKLVLIKLAFAMPFVSNKIILSERNDPYSVPEKKLKRMIRDWAFEHADKCVFQTPDARDYFSERVKKKSVIIPNPINAELPERYIGLREKVIVAVGRLSSQKNYPMLLHAFVNVHEAFPDYRLVIYGRGELENELIDLSKSLHISDFVSFAGFSSSIYEDILKCSIYVSSSDFEGISNSMLEALALGLPSVVTDCPAGGARMAINDHVNGILVPVGDEKAMSNAICELLSDSVLAEQIGDEAYKIRQKYPVKKIAEQWMDLF